MNQYFLIKEWRSYCWFWMLLVRKTILIMPVCASCTLWRFVFKVFWVWIPFHTAHSEAEQRGFQVRNDCRLSSSNTTQVYQIWYLYPDISGKAPHLVKLKQEMTLCKYSKLFNIILDPANAATGETPSPVSARSVVGVNIGIQKAQRQAAFMVHLFVQEDLAHFSPEVAYS